MFRAYDVRGLAHEQVSPEAAYLIAREFAEIIKEKYQISSPTIIVGRDCRTHGPELESAVLHGLLAADCIIKEIGVTPTTLNYFAICSTRADGGIQVTASHNDKEDNGLKMSLRECEAFYGQDIQQLYNRIIARDEAPMFVQELSKRPQSQSITKLDIASSYVARMVEMFPNVGAGKTVVVDAGNGVAGPVYPEVLRQVGCEVIELYTKPDGNFPNHQPDPSQQHTLKDLQAKVLEIGADIGFAYDGDADRMGMVDEQGSIRIADEILMLLAKDYTERNANGGVVFTATNSARIPSLVTKWGGTPIMCPVGSANVEHKMTQHKAELGGEISGHFFLAEDYYYFGDPLVATLRTLSIMKLKNESISKLMQQFPVAIREPEIRPNCPDDRKAIVVKAMENYYKQHYDVDTLDGVRVEFGNGAWTGIRQSNTSPKLSISFEAKTEEDINSMKFVLSEQLKNFPEVEVEL